MRRRNPSFCASMRKVRFEADRTKPNLSLQKGVVGGWHTITDETAQAPHSTESGLVAKKEICKKKA